MRKVTFLFVGCFMCILGYANPKAVPLVGDDPDIRDLPQKAPARLPQVSYEDLNLYIVSPFYVDDVEIIIRDVVGNIIYDVVTDLPASSYVIILPDDIVNQKYSIELLYGNRHLIGFF